MRPSLAIFFIGLSFGIAETWHFGWNWTPQSASEAICDGITSIIMTLSVVVAFLERR